MNFHGENYICFLLIDMEMLNVAEYKVEQTIPNHFANDFAKRQHHVSVVPKSYMLTNRSHRWVIAFSDYLPKCHGTSECLSP